MELVNKALLFASAAHQDQKDAAGHPYFTHVYRVYHRLAEWLKPLGLKQNLVEIGLATALLHDTVEDTDVTIEQITVEFNPEIARLVGELTGKHGLTYLDNIRRLANIDNLGILHMLLLLVKLSDNRDNSDPLRIHYLSDEKKSIVKRYYSSMEIINKALEQRYRLVVS